MKENTLGKLLNVLGILATVAILIGAFLKIQKIEWAYYLYTYEFLAWFIISSLEISYLKKVIKDLRSER